MYSPPAFVSSFILPFTGTIGAILRPYLCTIFFSPFGSWFLPGMHFRDFLLSFPQAVISGASCLEWSLLPATVLYHPVRLLHNCSFANFHARRKPIQTELFKSKAVIYARLTFHLLGQKLKVWLGPFDLGLPHNFS